MHRDKPNYKSQDYYPQNAGQRKEWNNGEREKGDKNGQQKTPSKKETQNFEQKRKP